MTIAAGFICSDGIVIGADTQESYGDEKAHVNKLAPFTGINWVGAIAGAGIGYLVDYARDRILDRINITKPGTSIGQLRDDFSNLFLDLYNKEFLKYPAALEDKQIQMLIGLCDKSEAKTYLFSVDSTLVRQITKQRLIGTGEVLKELAGDFHGMKLSMTQSMWAAMYVVWDAKQRYSGVGGETHVIGIHSSGVIRPERIWDIGQKEKIFERIDSMRNLLLVSLEQTTGNHIISARMRFIEKALKASKKEIDEMDKRFEKQKAAGKKSNEQLAKEIAKKR